MISIPVNASKPYRVHIEEGLLQNAGEVLRQAAPGGRVALVTDETVLPLYGSAVQEICMRHSLQCAVFTLPCGEAAKTAEQYLRLLHFLAEQGFTRSDAVAALGGGSVCDIAGFAAATFLRGMGLVMLPTTLLAAVDASVGGKNGIDLPCAKNSVGTVYQPDVVLCDPAFFDTLDSALLRDGCAEMIKCAMLGADGLWQRLQNGSLSPDAQSIAACIDLKCSLVEQDEHDHGLRRLLNLGHTLGHAAEVLSGYGISHGTAVAMGMLRMTRIACSLGLCAEVDAAALAQMLQRYDLFYELPFTAEELFAVTEHDKKRSGSEIALVFPHAVGDCRIHRVSMESWHSLLLETE